MKVIKIDDKNYTISLTAKELEKIEGCIYNTIACVSQSKKEDERCQKLLDAIKEGK